MDHSLPMLVAGCVAEASLLLQALEAIHPPGHPARARCDALREALRNLRNSADRLAGLQGTSDG